MRHEEERLVAAAEELKGFSANITDKDTLADLDIIVDGFQTMRPYLSVGLKVCASQETLEAIDRLHKKNQLTQELRNTLMNAVESARKPKVPLLVQQAARKPCRRVTPRHLGRSPVLGTKTSNRWA